ncbi:MAG: nucleoside-diphosphate sugar epimerase/dehydratase, partial [Parafilimonas sp.]
MIKPSKFFSIGYMPRWLIVCMDVILSFFSIVFSYLLRFNFQTEKIDTSLFTRGIIITVSVYLIFFFAFQSFKEIIRHTTFLGVFKILLAVASANIVLLLVTFLFSKQVRLIPYSITIINFFISFFMLAGSRIAIKKLFETAIAIKKDVIVIFGAGAMGLAALKTIQEDKLGDWRVMAFIDDDNSKQNKFIGGIKVFSSNSFSKTINKWSVKRAIIAVNNISLKRRNEIADLFIQHGVKVSILPYSQQWIHDPFKIRRLRDIKIEDLLEREPIQINNNAISATIKNKSILITGAAGSIGSEIVKQVAAFQPKILLLCDMAESPLHDIGLIIQENFPGISYKLLIGSVTDVNSMENIFTQYNPSIVFHAAAYKHVPMMEDHPHEAILNNVNGTRIIADLSVKYNVERFVMVSTDKAVNPTNVMGASKRIAEMYVQSLNNCSNTRFITTRFGNVLDSNGSVIPRFKAQLAKGGPITVTHPDITRFFMTIPEACQLVLEAGIMGNGGEIFIFDMGESVRIKDLAEKMIRLAGLKPQEDIEIRYTGLRPGEKLYEEVLNVLETTTKTYHPKIKIAKVRPVAHDTIVDDLKILIMVAECKTHWDCVKQMKAIVPEFVSN